MLTPDLDGIPPELKARQQWVAFRLDKSPVNPKNGDGAKANDPETWGDFSQAVSLWQAHQGNGIAGIGDDFPLPTLTVGLTWTNAGTRKPIR